jgi:hydrogenase expression/formation protein HypE
MSKFGQPLDIENGHIEMHHGSGGKAMAQLIEELFFPAFSNAMLLERNDQAIFPTATGRMVVSTDAHVISPIFFPGGNIGSLAVHGTVNDVAMSGATPLYLSVAMILEEGLPLKQLQTIVTSMADAAKKAGVAIVTGDTKVVERGKGDGIYITTTGVGVVPNGISISGANARPGDAILVSGTMGDHGMAIMATRNGLKFAEPLLSDSASLASLVADLVSCTHEIHVLRDPTRGGLATTLNEITEQSAVGMRLDEEKIPVREVVRGACELLGLDPLYVANEGKLIAICPAAVAEKLLGVMRAHPLGRDASIIGTVVEDPNHFVEMETQFGGRRIVQMLTGEQLPRIC